MGLKPGHGLAFGGGGGPGFFHSEDFMEDLQSGAFAGITGRIFGSPEEFNFPTLMGEFAGMVPLLFGLEGLLLPRLLPQVGRIGRMALTGGALGLMETPEDSRLGGVMRGEEPISISALGPEAGRLSQAVRQAAVFGGLGYAGGKLSKYLGRGAAEGAAGVGEVAETVLPREIMLGGPGLRQTEMFAPEAVGGLPGKQLELGLGGMAPEILEGVSPRQLSLGQPTPMQVRRRIVRKIGGPEDVSPLAAERLGAAGVTPDVAAGFQQAFKTEGPVALDIPAERGAAFGQQLQLFAPGGEPALYESAGGIIRMTNRPAVARTGTIVLADGTTVIGSDAMSVENPLILLTAEEETSALAFQTAGATKVLAETLETSLAGGPKHKMVRILWEDPATPGKFIEISPSLQPEDAVSGEVMRKVGLLSRVLPARSFLGEPIGAEVMSPAITDYNRSITYYMEITDRVGVRFMHRLEGAKLPQSFRENITVLLEEHVDGVGRFFESPAAKKAGGQSLSTGALEKLGPFTRHEIETAGHFRSTYNELVEEFGLQKIDFYSPRKELARHAPQLSGPFVKLKPELKFWAELQRSAEGVADEHARDAFDLLGAYMRTGAMRNIFGKTLDRVVPRLKEILRAGILPEDVARYMTQGRFARSVRAAERLTNPAKKAKALAALEEQAYKELVEGSDRWRMFNEWLTSVRGVPAKMDTMLAASMDEISRAIGLPVEQNFGAGVAQLIAHAAYAGGLGLRVVSAPVKNLTQTNLVLAELGIAYTYKGIAETFGGVGLKETVNILRSQGVLSTAIETFGPEAMGTGVIEKLNKFMSKWTRRFLFAFIGVDHVNRAIAWHGSIAKFRDGLRLGSVEAALDFIKARTGVRQVLKNLLNEGNVGEALNTFARDIVANTHYIYGKGNMAEILRGTVGKMGAIYMTWPVNYMNQLRLWKQAGRGDTLLKHFIATWAIATFAGKYLEIDTHDWFLAGSMPTAFAPPLQLAGSIAKLGVRELRYDYGRLTIGEDPQMAKLRQQAFQTMLRSGFVFLPLSGVARDIQEFGQYRDLRDLAGFRQLPEVREERRKSRAKTAAARRKEPSPTLKPIAGVKPIRF